MAAVVSPYRVRLMTLDDIPQVSAIERESFPTMWPQTAYTRELQQNALAHYLVVSDARLLTPGADRQSGQNGLLVRLRRALGGTEPAPAPEPAGEQLVGFIGLWFLLDECHIVTVAVRTASRRQGIGELLLLTAIALAQQRGERVLTLECRVSNTGAQALYAKYGFRSVGVRKRYYTDNNEDALIMTTPEIQTPAYQAQFERLRTAHRERWGAAESALTR